MTGGLLQATLLGELAPWEETGSTYDPSGRWHDKRRAKSQ